MSHRQTHTFNRAFVTEGNDEIPNPTVAYQTWGELNDDRDNVILICHALTGNTEADKWFNGLFGPGKVLDPENHFIICTNSLGSCYGTTGPASINPETGRLYQIDFPRITIRDMVHLQQLLLDELQIEGIETVIDGSMGGMQAREWCIMDDRPCSDILIGMGKDHNPWAIGISHTQRQAIYNDPNWSGGHYTKQEPPVQGLSVARQIAMISYRSESDYEVKFSRKKQSERDQFQVESYLSYQGKKLTERFDAASYVRLTQAMDSHDVARGRHSYKQAFAEINIPTLVVGIDTDRLYPIQEQQELAELLPDSRYRMLRSKHGHDAFLIEFDRLNSIIKPFLLEIPTATVPSL